MDAMTIKIDAQYKERQSHAKKPTPDLDDDDIPMSREEEAKFMQTFSDRSFQYPVGIAENMLVEVGKFTFPVDFVILEMEEDSKKPSILNDDTCFSIDVIDEILEEEFDALLDEGSKILHSIEGTLLEKEIFSEFDEFMAMITDENSESESDTEEPPFEKSPSTPIIKLKHLSKNLLRILNSKLFRIIWNMYSYKNHPFSL
ncbi:hypothetical protein Tco_0744517 [Tanacetum coccineum]